jgi:hypothetical protein
LASLQLYFSLELSPTLVVENLLKKNNPQKFSRMDENILVARLSQVLKFKMTSVNHLEEAVVLAFLTGLVETSKTLSCLLSSASQKSTRSLLVRLKMQILVTQSTTLPLRRWFGVTTNIMEKVVVSLTIVVALPQLVSKSTSNFVSVPQRVVLARFVINQEINLCAPLISNRSVTVNTQLVPVMSHQLISRTLLIRKSTVRCT